jgi:hypothetical protein
MVTAGGGVTNVLVQGLTATSDASGFRALILHRPVESDEALQEAPATMGSESACVENRSRRWRHSTGSDSSDQKARP